MKALAAVLHERGGKMVIEEIELAEPKEDEVLVKVVGVGVCHTDEGGRQWMIEPHISQTLNFKELKQCHLKAVFSVKYSELI